VQVFMRILSEFWKKLNNPYTMHQPMKLLCMLGLLLLAACTPHAMMEHPQITSEEAFIAEMIPHHQEAVDSSRLMLDSENPAVRELAQSIISAQESEIAMMRSWMQEWYPDSAYMSTYSNMMPDLSTVQGEAKDREYLKGMQGHHKGAIQMAKQAQQLELRPEVRTLTENIISTQTAEIKQIDAILG
jgi:uncharacterized protein (DUF305 family)